MLHCETCGADTRTIALFVENGRVICTACRDKENNKAMLEQLQEGYKRAFIGENSDLN